MWTFDMYADPDPELRPVPKAPRGFVVRMDLRGAKPPVWRRLELRGDLTLLDLHDVIQTSMGWENCHLHKFRTAGRYGSPSFLSEYDLSEGDRGVFEGDVRLDQVVAAKGDALWYEYDFGDSWDHLLKVEKVLEQPPEAVHCSRGRMACPPEDCGGIWGYQEVAGWVRSGYAADQRPDIFDTKEEGLEWLVDWDPDAFDVEQVNKALGLLGV